MKRARTTRHDFFLVTDNYANQITTNAQKALAFLEVKDIALRRLNAMKQGILIDESGPVGVRWVIAGLTASLWHIKFLFKIMIINCTYRLYSITKSIR